MNKPNAIKEWRRRHGLSQQAAAEAVGVSARMIRHYESGKHAVPLTVALACAAVERGLPPIE